MELFGTVINDPLSALTEDQPRTDTEVRQHDRAIEAIGAFLTRQLRGGGSHAIEDSCQGGLVFTLGDKGVVHISQPNGTSYIEPWQLGLPAANRLRAALGA